jgi:hypothetical protein
VIRETSGLTAPTSPSKLHAGYAWNDRLLESIEAWRWPLPVTLGVLAIIAIIALHAVEWAFGPLRPGEIDPFLLTVPVYPLGILAIIAIQNRTAVTALARFRPATDLDDEAYAGIRYELTHQPALGALVGGVAFGAFGVVIELSKETAAVALESYPVAYLKYTVVAFASYALAGPFLIRTARLLRRVHELHREARHIDLLDPAPIHAFSSVTALVGLSLIAITTLSITTDPATHETTGGVILTFILLGAAIACFILPLWGMHRRLQAEQIRLSGEVARRIETTIARLYDDVDHDRPGATELRDRLTALLATRDLIQRVSTWPWRPETPRWVFSGLLVPIVIWGATRILERAIS